MYFDADDAPCDNARTLALSDALKMFGTSMSNNFNSSLALNLLQKKKNIRVASVYSVALFFLWEGNVQHFGIKVELMQRNGG